MAKREKLWCQVGNHWWQRQHKPGRKPVSCPDHRDSESATPTPAVAIQYAEGIAHGKVKGEDGTVIEIKGVNAGDKGMVEWSGTEWSWELFEAAPKPKPPKPKPKAQKAAGGSTERERRIQVVEPPAEKPKLPKPKSPPAHFEEVSTTEIIDDQTYIDAALPGIKIHHLARDRGGVWTCQVTVNNEETFSLIRHGGWQIRHEGETKGALQVVADAIQARVVKLEKAHKGDSEEENDNGEEDDE